MNTLKIFECVGIQGSGKTTSLEKLEKKNIPDVKIIFISHDFRENIAQKLCTILKHPLIFFYFFILTLHTFQFRYSIFGPLVEYENAIKQYSQKYKYILFDESLVHFLYSSQIYKKYDTFLYKFAEKKLIHIIATKYSHDILYFHAPLEVCLKRLENRKLYPFDFIHSQKKEKILKQRSPELKKILETYKKVEKNTIFDISGENNTEKIISEMQKIFTS